MFMRKSEPISESRQFRDLLDLVTYNTWLILDLDNTVMESTRVLGSDQWFSKLLIQAHEHMESKEEATLHVITLYHAIQYHVQAQIVEENIKHIIKALQDIGIPVLGLTARDDVIAHPTLRQLEESGIDLYKNTELLAADNYRRGIIFCGGKDKGKCMIDFFEENKILPYHIVMVDDKERHLLAVKKAAEKAKIHFNSIRYGFLDEKVKEVDMNEAHRQLADLSHMLSPKTMTAIQKLPINFHTHTFFNQRNNKHSPTSTDTEEKNSSPSI